MAPPTRDGKKTWLVVDNTRELRVKSRGSGKPRTLRKAMKILKDDELSSIIKEGEESIKDIYIAEYCGEVPFEKGVQLYKNQAAKVESGLVARRVLKKRLSERVSHRYSFTLGFRKPHSTHSDSNR